jgi:hypothetical protein
MSLQELKAIYESRDGAARAVKKAGGKVGGYLSENVPEELIAAAGYMPYRLSGDPVAWANALGDKKPVMLEAIASIFDLIVAGRFDFLDGLVIPASRKQILAFYPRLLAAQKANPKLRLPKLTVLDRTTSNFLIASVFNRDRIFDLKKTLETWSGAPIGDDALRAAIATSNEIRRLIGELGALRAAAKVSGVEALQAIGAAKMMPRDKANTLLSAFVKEAGGRAARKGPRVFVAGSALDDVALYAMIEAEGATVVGENHDWGSIGAEVLVDTALAPMDAIADRYHHVPPAVVYPLSAAVEACVRRARAAQADRAVIIGHRLDDIQLFEIPDVRKALDGVGLRSLYLEQQPYHLAETPALRGEIGRFLAAA